MEEGDPYSNHLADGRTAFGKYSSGILQKKTQGDEHVDQRPKWKNHMAKTTQTADYFPCTHGHGQNTQVAELFLKEWRWAYFHLNEQEVFKVASSPAEWVSDDAPSNIIKMRKTHSPSFHQSISHPPQIGLGVPVLSIAITLEFTYKRKVEIDYEDF